MRAHYIFLSALFLATPCLAQDAPLIGKIFNVGPSGQPFCDSVDDLQEYMVAALSGNSSWVGKVKHCVLLGPGPKMFVIDDLPSDSAIGHVVKVRVIFKGQSAVGYTLSLGLQR